MTDLELERKVRLWDAINDYVRACGGDPGKLGDQTAREKAVVAVEQAAFPGGCEGCSAAYQIDECRKRQSCPVRSSWYACFVRDDRDAWHLQAVSLARLVLKALSCPTTAGGPLPTDEELNDLTTAAKQILRDVKPERSAADNELYDYWFSLTEVVLSYQKASMTGKPWVWSMIDGKHFTTMTKPGTAPDDIFTDYIKAAESRPVSAVRRGVHWMEDYEYFPH